MRRWAAILAAALAAVTVAACGDDESERAGAPLAWEKAPELYVPKTLPGDRILFGRVRNTSPEPVTLKSTEIRLSDADGRPVEGTGRFVESFVHGNIPLDIQAGPDQAPPARLRLGYEARIAPGESVPLTVSWRQGKRGTRPVAVTLGDGVRLEVPQGPPKRV